eukprot:14186395-Alexandrium_andersonii.AAC.1
MVGGAVVCGCPGLVPHLGHNRAAVGLCPGQLGRGFPCLSGSGAGENQVGGVGVVAPPVGPVAHREGAP